MAQKFGGKFSPSGTSDGRDSAPLTPVRDPVGARANLLFVPPVLLVFTSLGDGPTVLAAGLIGGGILTLAAWLLRDGLRAEAAYHARKVARRPAIPRKIFASALTGIGLALAAFSGDTGTIGSVVYGIAAAGLHVAAFGIDPLKNKRVEGIDEFQQDRVARVVDEAEGFLATMTSRITPLRDRALTARVSGFQTAARHMIRTVEEDPRDLTAARKYLVIYLQGARDATIKFADLYTRKPDQSVRDHYEALLTDLEQNFAARTEQMMRDDRQDMDIEIKVLRDRLQREGVSPKA